MTYHHEQNKKIKAQNDQNNRQGPKRSNPNAEWQTNIQDG